MTLQEKALEIIQTQIGKQEVPKGSNWGPDVQKYLASVNVYEPAPWCMALVYWAYQQAAATMGILNPLLKTGRVLDQWKGRQQFSVVTPEPGDIFIMDFGGGLGHTGIVELVDTDLFHVHTIDGNTNLDGSREGYEVERKTRARGKIKGYLRFR